MRHRRAARYLRVGLTALSHGEVLAMDRHRMTRRDFIVAAALADTGRPGARLLGAGDRAGTQTAPPPARSEVAQIRSGHVVRDRIAHKHVLAKVLDQVTAIVNVPFLKTHNIAGFTCCLKNLLHALIKHPARFHGAHGVPFIADIVALPKIREKLRLNLVNALRVVFDRGPDANEDFTWDEGLILAGRDPVACDSMGLETLNSRRSAVGLCAIDRTGSRTAYLRAASQRGLGTANPYRIEVKRVPE